MRILMISPRFPPIECGVADFTRILCENLAKRGLAVDILTAKNTDIINSGYKYNKINLYPEIEGWSFKSFPKIKRFIEKRNYQIIHFQYNRPAFNRKIAINFLPFYLKSKNRRYKIISTIHDLPHPWRSRAPLFWVTMLAFLNFNDCIILTNKPDGLSVTATLPFIKKKIALIPVGSNIPYAEISKSEHRNLRDELHINDDVHVITYFGFIRGEKDFTGLFWSIRKLLDEKHKLKLIMLGGAREKELYLKLKVLEKKYNLENNIIWIGYSTVKEISQILSISDMCVLPFKRGVGTNSGSLAAAVLHDLPLIVTKPAAVPTVFQNKRNIILVSPGQPDELKEAISSLLTTPALKQKLISRMDNLKTYLSWDSIANTTLRIYKKLID